MDEVSMVACHELHAISARLSQVTNIHDIAFSGFDVILAGDFAQLPPTSAHHGFVNPCRYAGVGEAGTGTGPT